MQPQPVHGAVLGKSDGQGVQVHQGAGRGWERREGGGEGVAGVEGEPDMPGAGLDHGAAVGLEDVP